MAHVWRAEKPAGEHVVRTEHKTDLLDTEFLYRTGDLENCVLKSCATPLNRDPRV
jgi:hypothetical protein